MTLLFAYICFVKNILYCSCRSFKSVHFIQTAVFEQIKSVENKRLVLKELFKYYLTCCNKKGLENICSPQRELSHT